MQRLACLLLMLGCASPLDVQGASPFTPPPVFAEYWREIETCSGLSGDWRRVEWYVVPAGQIVWDGTHYSGVWQPPHTIYISDVVLEHLDRYATTVKHEMLHDLRGRGGHPPVFETCGVN